jgi:hypothetical protein
MARSFDLLPELPIFPHRPVKRYQGECLKTPPSFYDTLESGDVKGILVPLDSFLPVSSRAWHKTSNLGLFGLFSRAGVGSVQWANNGRNMLMQK